MKLLITALALALFIACAPATTEAAPGKMTGGVKYDMPVWFKMSFLDLKDDLKEANAHGRQIMLFLHLEECPYCARMLNENFREGESKEFIERHFDVIGIDIRGSRTVNWFDGHEYTELTLAKMLKVYATPTIIFIDPEGRTALRLDGFRKRQAFRQALDYVQQKAYRQESLTSFIAKQRQAPYRLRAEPMFRELTDFKGYRKPLAVMFEDKDCTDCDEFHDKVLTHPEVLPELSKFLVVRLDAYSNQPITDIDGKRTTPKQWVEQLGLTYRPGIVLFNESRERARVDGMLYHFHFKELLRYVSGGYYKKFGSFSQYNAVRRPELLQQGINIDYAQ
jgi:thioredoxin-related protein